MARRDRGGCWLQKLKEREELVAKDADNKRSADLSSQIRADIREIKAKIDELTKIQRKEAKRARVRPLQQRAPREPQCRALG